MIKLICLFFSVFVMAINPYAYAVSSDKNEVDIDTKLEIASSYLVPAHKLFNTEEQFDKFLDNLFNKGEYNSDKQILSASLTDIVIACLETRKEFIKWEKQPAGEYDLCTGVAKDVLQVIINVQKEAAANDKYQGVI